MSQQSASTPPTESDEVVSYLKHHAAPNVIKQLNSYASDLSPHELINPRILDELYLTLRWINGDTAHEVVTEELDAKTLYPSPRDMLVDDVLHALRGYRRMLVVYGEEYENKEALGQIGKMLHRDDEIKQTVPAAKRKEVPKVQCTQAACSCGEECQIASLPPLPDPSESPPLEEEEAQLIENLKTFEARLEEWVVYLEKMMRAYRHFMGREKRVDENIVRKTTMVVTLAKGKFRGGKGLVDAEKDVRLPVPGSWVENEGENVEKGKAEDEEETDEEDEEFDVDESSFERLAEQLRHYYEGVFNNPDVAEVDAKVLRAARRLVEKAGEVQSLRPDIKEIIETSGRAAKGGSGEGRPQETTKTVESGNESTEISSSFAQEAREIEKIMGTDKEATEENTPLVEASQKLIDVVKEINDSGRNLNDDPKVLKAARKVLELAKVEGIESEKVELRADEPAKKVKQKKTVRFAKDLVQVCDKKM